MIRSRLWPGALCVAVLATTGGCRAGEPRFCSEFRRVDVALGPLREAKAQGDFQRVPVLVDAVGDAYERIEPPAALQDDWAAVVEFFRVEAEQARSLLASGRFPGTAPEDDARYDAAFTSITDYGVAHCGRHRGVLVP
jgi:hypothetical protein